MKNVWTLDKFLSLHTRVRRRFPLLEMDLLGNPRTYLNCGAGTLTVDAAAEAMGQTAQTAHPMPGEVYPAEISTRDLHWKARSFAADFLYSAKPEEISFHQSTTHALFNLAFALQELFDSGHNLIVTDLDHMANVSPWERIYGELKGCPIRRAPITSEYSLDVEGLLDLVDHKTGLVAVTMAANAFGSIVPLKQLIHRIREINPGCIICVDAVHHALHGPIDIRDLDCDFLAFSGYKIFGPMLGVLWGKNDLQERSRPYRVETAKDVSPTKFEQGMWNNAVLASFSAALEYLLWIEQECRDESAPSEEKGRGERFRSVMGMVEEYEKSISGHILAGFQSFDPKKFRCFGLTDPSLIDRRDPTFAFEIIGMEASETKRALWERYQIQIADGNHYSAAVYRLMNRTGVCRASFCHYDRIETADRFLHALSEMLTGRI